MGNVSVVKMTPEAMEAKARQLLEAWMNEHIGNDPVLRLDFAEVFACVADAICDEIEEAAGIVIAA